MPFKDIGATEKVGELNLGRSIWLYRITEQFAENCTNYLALRGYKVDSSRKWAAVANEFGRFPAGDIVYGKARISVYPHANPESAYSWCGPLEPGVYLGLGFKTRHATITRRIHAIVVEFGAVYLASASRGFFCKPVSPALAQPEVDCETGKAASEDKCRPHGRR